MSTKIPPLFHLTLYTYQLSFLVFKIAPPWTCSTSDWTESIKTHGLSNCSEPNFLLNGLIRGENGGLEDYIDRLEGAMCCSAPLEYKDDDLKCRNSLYSNSSG